MPRALGVGAVGLVPGHIGTHLMRGEEDHPVSEVLDLSGPEVGRAAGFHDHGCRSHLREEEEERPAGEPPPLRDPSRLVRDGGIEDRLCDVDGDHAMLLDGLLLFLSKGDSDTRCRPSRKEESISSMEQTSASRPPRRQPSGWAIAPRLRADGARCSSVCYADPLTSSQVFERCDRARYAAPTSPRDLHDDRAGWCVGLREPRRTQGAAGPRPPPAPEPCREAPGHP